MRLRTLSVGYLAAYHDVVVDIENGVYGIKILSSSGICMFCWRSNCVFVHDQLKPGDINLHVCKVFCRGLINSTVNQKEMERKEGL